ncbi:universal stress protein [Dongshaea marina]|uniref:universal stress protein n=1 Tax=Dongshaea marina TaxID=2047966 RepID=UPI00131EE569|nr:universal stress protein [Dongshaea marina]
MPIKTRSAVGYRCILCCVDLLNPDESYLRRAAEFAKSREAELELVYVAEPHHRSFLGRLFGSAEAEQNLEELIYGARQQLEQWLPQLPGHISKQVMGVGSLADDLASQLKESQPDLIIMGQHHLSPLYRLLEGDELHGLVQHCACDLLILEAKRDWCHPMSLLAAVDFEPTTPVLLSMADQIACGLGGRLTALHVTELLQHANIALDLEEEPGEHLKQLQLADREMATALEQSDEFTLKACLLKTGEVEQLLLRGQRELKPDLMLLGNTHSSSIFRLDGHLHSLIHQLPGDILVLRIS